MNDMTRIKWKTPGYIVLWDIAARLRADRSEVANTHMRFKEANADYPNVIDDYYQPCVPEAWENKLIRFFKAEGMNGVYDSYDLSEEEFEEVELTRDTIILDAIKIYEGPRLNRTNWPWLRPLRKLAELPDITSEERRRLCIEFEART